MRTARTDQTGLIARLIRVFAGHTGHFVMLRLIKHIICDRTASQAASAYGVQGNEFGVC